MSGHITEKLLHYLIARVELSLCPDCLVFAIPRQLPHAPFPAPTIHDTIILARKHSVIRVKRFCATPPLPILVVLWPQRGPLGGHCSDMRHACTRPHHHWHDSHFIAVTMEERAQSPRARGARYASRDSVALRGKSIQ